MNIAIRETDCIGEVAVAYPHLIELLEDYGIDYYCRGRVPMREACWSVGLEPVDLIGEARTRPNAAKLIRWNCEPLARLTSWIVESHHNRCLKVLPRIDRLFSAVRKKFDASHPELKRLHQIFRHLKKDYCDHLAREERQLFPQIEELEAADKASRRPTPPYVGGIYRWALAEYHEHELISERLRKLREISSNFTVPQDASADYRKLYDSLRELERNMHEQMHLENNVLLPRAGEIENRIRPRTGSLSTG